ncbi:hypothetical protein BsWGS_07501 [Bradybaena similaris]
MLEESRKLTEPRDDGTSETNSIISTASYGKVWKRLQPIEINLMTLRNSEKPLCEVCDRFGKLQCASCRVTYYCSYKHMEIDEELHMDICRILKSLRAPIEFSVFPTVRERMKAQYIMKAYELSRFALIRGRTWMVEGRLDSALASCTASIKAAKLACRDPRETILPMTIATECYVKKNKMHKARRSLAECLQLEKALDDISDQCKAAIRHVEGLVSLKTHDYYNSRYCFAEQIYLYTEIYDPDHITTASGYMNLAHVFHRKGRQLVARSLIRRAVDIWSMYLTGIVEKQLEDTSLALLSVIPDNIPKTDVLSDYSKFASRTTVFFEKLQDICDRKEAASGLQSCCIMFRELKDNIVKPEDYIEVEYALACLDFVNNNYSDAKNKFVDIVNKCVTHGLKDKEQPVYQRAVKFRRESNYRVKAVKRHSMYHTPSRREDSQVPEQD